MAALSNTLTQKMSNAIRQLTMEETRDLVFQMGVPLNTLDDITAQYDGENRKQHFLQAWLNMDRDASWEKLVAGLRNINQDALATKIESEHLPSAAVASSGSPSLLSTSSASVSAPPEIATPAPVGSLPPPPPTAPSPDQPFEQKVAATNDSIEHLQGEFSDLKSDARESLSERESQDTKFVRKFRDHLLDLPVTKKQVHIRFFSRNEDELLKAKTIQKIFIILGRYCNYSNYEIIFHVVKRFCPKLKERMLKYRESLTSFEKATTVDVYLHAISARPSGKLREGFIRMTMKIDKPPSECTLYEIRELKEAIEEEASLESYSMYIETPGEGSVQVVLHVHEEVGWMVGVVFTLDFRRRYLTDVRIGEKVIMEYLVRLCAREETPTTDTQQIEIMASHNYNITMYKHTGGSIL